MKRHFIFSRHQKLGLISLSVLLLAGIVLLNVNYSQHLPERADIVASNFDLFSTDSSDLEQDESLDSPSTIDYFYPNELSVYEWSDLGFSEKQAQSIVKYRENFGPFKEATDVAKIYVISDEKFLEIKPFMLFENEVAIVESDESTASRFSENDKSKLTIEINEATAEELQQISGIGKVYSERIVKYRNSLGGFSSSIQYGEVYGLKDKSLAALVSNTVIDKSKIRKLNVNECSKSDLKKHPIFKDWEVVSAILLERQKYKLTSLNFLKDQSVINEKELIKMQDYASFD